jgi:hypothetical protein
MAYPKNPIPSNPAIPRGVLVLFSIGEYSAYASMGLFQVVRAIPFGLSEVYKKATRDIVSACPWDYNPGGFTDWLVGQGYLLPVSYYEIHVESTDGQLVGMKCEAVHYLPCQEREYY